MLKKGGLLLGGCVLKGPLCLTTRQSWRSAPAEQYLCLCFLQYNDPLANFGQPACLVRSQKARLLSEKPRFAFEFIQNVEGSQLGVFLLAEAEVFEDGQGIPDVFIVADLKALGDRIWVRPHVYIDKWAWGLQIMHSFFVC
jgi:hypothetical protein